MMAPIENAHQLRHQQHHGTDHTGMTARDAQSTVALIVLKPSQVFNWSITALG